MSKTLGLALGSGGARGIAHIGFLKALEEAQIPVSYIAGSSMGAVVGACYSAGMSIDEMKEIALQLKLSDLADLTPNPIGTLALLRSKKVQNIIVEHLGDLTFDQLKIPLACTACDILTGEAVVFQEGKVATAVLASSAIPSVFRPVPYEDKLLVDGGVVSRVPVREVKQLGADVVVAVDVLKNADQKIEKVGNIVSLMLRLFDVMDSQCTALKKVRDQHLVDLWIEPEMQGISQYFVKNLDKAYDEGYAVGMQHIAQIRELLKD